MYDNVTDPVEQDTTELQQSIKVWESELNVEYNVAYGAAELSLSSNVAYYKSGKPPEANDQDYVIDDKYDYI